MTDDERREIVAAMREAIARARGYADYFGWRPNRDLEEAGVVQNLCESIELSGSKFLHSIIPRGRGNDPPDCEGRDFDQQRIAIEVTEIVSEEAIRAFKAGRVFDWASWSRDELSPRFQNQYGGRMPSS